MTKEKTVVFFDTIKQAIPVAKIKEKPLYSTLSIEGEREEIENAVREAGISPTNYSIATVYQASPSND